MQGRLSRSLERSLSVLDAMEELSLRVIVPDGGFTSMFAPFNDQQQEKVLGYVMVGGQVSATMTVQKEWVLASGRSALDLVLQVTDESGGERGGTLARPHAVRAQASPEAGSEEVARVERTGTRTVCGASSIRSLARCACAPTGHGVGEQGRGSRGKQKKQLDPVQTNHAGALGVEG